MTASVDVQYIHDVTADLTRVMLVRGADSEVITAFN